MIYIQVLNHGMAPEDLGARSGAKLTTVAARVRHACLDIVWPGHEDDPRREPGEVIVDIPFHATLCDGPIEETPVIVLADILTWPTRIPESARDGLSKALAEAIGQTLAAYFSGGRKLHVSVRTPDHAEASSWSR